MRNEDARRNKKLRSNKRKGLLARSNAFIASLVLVALLLVSSSMMLLAEGLSEPDLDVLDTVAIETIENIENIGCCHDGLDIEDFTVEETPEGIVATDEILAEDEAPTLYETPNEAATDDSAVDEATLGEIATDGIFDAPLGDINENDDENDYVYYGPVWDEDWAIEAAPFYVDITGFMAVDVANYAQFRLALQDQDVEVINLTGNVDRPSSTTAAVAIGRDLIINGNGYRLQINGATNANTRSIMQLGSTGGNARTLTLNNVRMYHLGTAGFDNDRRYIIYSSAANSVNWTVVIGNDVRVGAGAFAADGTVDLIDVGILPRVTPFGISMYRSNSTLTADAAINRQGFLWASNSTFIVAGVDNEFRKHDGGGHASFLNVRHFIMEPNSSLRTFSSGQTAGVTTAAGGTGGTSIYISNDGSVTVGAGATLDIRNINRNRAATTDAQVLLRDRAHGLQGSIRNLYFGNGATVRIEAIGNALATTRTSGAVGDDHFVNANTFRFNGATVDLIGESNRSFSLLMAHNMISAGTVTTMNAGRNHIVLENGATVSAFSRNSQLNNPGAVVLNAGNFSTTHISGGSTLNVYATAGANGFLAYGNNTRFDLMENSTLRVRTRASANNAVAAMRFRHAGVAQFNLNNSDILISTTANLGQAARMHGPDNVTNVGNGARFSARNYGNPTTAQAGDGTNPSGAGVIFTGDQLLVQTTPTRNAFNITGWNSQVDVFAYNGRGLFANTAAAAANTFFINAGPGTIFTVDGGTATLPAIGGPTLHFRIDDSLFFDFQNSRGGAALTSTGANSSLRALNTAFALWPFSAVGFDFEPTEHNAFHHINFHLTGASMANTIPVGGLVPSAAVDGTVNSTDVNSFRLNGTNAATHRLNIANAGRLSANNAVPVIDWLRTPSNADTRVFGRVMIPEGRPDIDPITNINRAVRPAWGGEVDVTVEFVYSEASSAPHQRMGTTESQVNVFGWGDLDGVFEVPYIPTGTTATFMPEDMQFRLISVTRGGGRSVLEADINAANAAFDRRVRDVTPPAIPTLTTALNSTSITELTGTGEAGSVIRVTTRANTTSGENWVMEGSVPRTATVAADGTFTFSLAGVTLADGNIIAIYASDNRGMADLNNLVGTVPGRDWAFLPGRSIDHPAGLLEPFPTVSGAMGNINPSCYQLRGVFPSASILFAERTWVAGCPITGCTTHVAGQTCIDPLFTRVLGYYPFHDATGSNGFPVRPEWALIIPRTARQAQVDVDWIRIPSDADGRIIGGVSVRFGHDLATATPRAATAGEVEVVMEIFDTVTGAPIGFPSPYRLAARTTNGFTRWGETFPAGSFEIDLSTAIPGIFPNDLLPLGFSIRVLSATIVEDFEGEGTTALPANFPAPRVIRDVTPPALPTITTPLTGLANAAAVEGIRSISGTAQPGTRVILGLIRDGINSYPETMFNEPFVATTQANGTFTIDFPAGFYLQDRDVISIHATDRQGIMPGPMSPESPWWGVGGPNPYQWTTFAPTTGAQQFSMIGLGREPGNINPRLSHVQGAAGTGFVAGDWTTVGCNPGCTTVHTVGTCITPVWRATQGSVVFHDATFPVRPEFPVLIQRGNEGFIWIETAPDNINFGIHAIGPNIVTAYNAVRDGELEVRDTRSYATRDEWQLFARVVDRDEVANDAATRLGRLHNSIFNHSITGALQFYDHTGTRVALSGHNERVFAHTPDPVLAVAVQQEITQVSNLGGTDNWSLPGVGLQFQHNASTLFQGTYEGEIAWTLVPHSQPD